ncbi:MAG: hypothetical protein M3R55_09965 [Acidobacteriota bacterium]|nr:hypothetical protein [Acidobacteriota bacterium]
MRSAPLVLVVAGSLAALAPLHARQTPDAAALIRAAAGYLETYATNVTGTTLEEKYTLIEISSGRMSTPLRIVSELVLLNPSGRVSSLRDAVSIDGARFPRTGPGIAALLDPPTLAGWDKAQARADSANRNFVSEIILYVNDPLMALHYVTPDTPSLFTHTIDGRKKINGVETVGLRFAEIRKEDRAYTLKTRGNAAVAGRLWVEPATGAIHLTELTLDAKNETARVSVTYAPDAALNVLLPSKLAGHYETRVQASGPTGFGAPNYGSSLKFQTNATYGGAKRRPIDLTKIRDGG